MKQKLHVMFVAALILTILPSSTLIPMVALAQAETQVEKSVTTKDSLAIDRGDWPTQAGPYTEEGFLSTWKYTDQPGPKSNHTLWSKWLHNIGGGFSTSPIVVNGKVFVNPPGWLYVQLMSAGYYSLDAETGETVWGPIYLPPRGGAGGMTSGWIAGGAWTENGTYVPGGGDWTPGTDGKLYTADFSTLTLPGREEPWGQTGYLHSLLQGSGEVVGKYDPEFMQNRALLQGPTVIYKDIITPAISGHYHQYRVYVQGVAIDWGPPLVVIGGVAALDGWTGEVIWNTTGATGGCCPVIAVPGNGLIYPHVGSGAMGGENAVVFPDGKAKDNGYEYDYRDWGGTPDETMFLMSALNETNGEIVWSVPAAYGCWEGAVDVEKNLYWVPNGKHIFCFDALTGKVKWRYDLPGNHVTRLAYDGERVYGNDLESSKTYCLEGKNGTLVWEKETGVTGWTSPVVAGNGLVYLGTQTLVAGDPNTLWCLNKTTGETVWKWDYKFPDKNGQDFSNLAIVKDRLYCITGDSILWCFGSGPTSIPVSVTASSLDLGESTIISGSLTDQSPDSPDAPVAGVTITLAYALVGGTYTTIGTVTTDSMGGFTYKWTPTAEGTYDVVASFAGTDSYESSASTIKVQVGPAAPTAPTASQVANEVVNKLPDYTPMFAGIIAAVVVAIIIGLYSIYDHRKLRK